MGGGVIPLAALHPANYSPDCRFCNGHTLYLCFFFRKEFIMHRLFIRISAIFLITAACASQSSAQSTYWKQYVIPGVVGTQVFFLDNNHGIIYGNPAGFDTSVFTQAWYTKNGSTWSPSICPSSVQFIYSIRLIKGKLYAATYGPDVLVSTDTGATWSFTGLGLSNTFDVYEDASGAIRAAPLGQPPDFGNNQTFSCTSFARADLLHCITTQSYEGTPFVSPDYPLFSGDGGKTWSAIGFAGTLFGAYGDTCGHALMVTGISDPGGYSSLTLGAS